MKQGAKQKIIGDHEIYSLYAKGCTQGLKLTINPCIS